MSVGLKDTPPHGMFQNLSAVLDPAREVHAPSVAAVAIPPSPAISLRREMLAGSVMVFLPGPAALSPAFVVDRS